MDNRVFISSTFHDLAEYRTSVQAGLRQLGVLDISMEHFGARDERPKEECIRLIKGQSDFFVGIYAHRYGYVPKGSKKSITHAEYEAAVKTGIPKLIYMIDEEVPWPVKLVEQGPAAEKLSIFKNYLLSKHICKKFNNKDNLAASVVADIGRSISINNSANAVGKNIPLRDIISVSEKHPNNKPIEYWNDKRNQIYTDSRGIFLTHVIRPSKKEGQLYDVFIYLLRHKSDDFSDVRYAQFFLGPYWNNDVFDAVEENKGFIGISTSAYGTFLCTCKVTFVDGSQIEIHRYIDFEAEKMKEIGPLRKYVHA